MRTTLVAILFILMPYAYADENKAYLIIDAAVTGSAKKPYWLALADQDSDEFIHISTTKPIVEVASGTWEIVHFDFDKSQRLWQNSRPAKFSMLMRIEKHKIHFLGRIELQRRRGLENEYSIIADSELIISACKEMPEAFKKYRLSLLHNPNAVPDRFVACPASS